MTSELPSRLGEHFSARGWTSPGDAVLVACSGGLDSLVLLHLCRFALPALDLRVGAAHFDHRMRPLSGDDAVWLAGVTRAWDVPLHVGRAPRVPTNENDAREMRYEFLIALRSREGARWLLTAHHADDQVETVLFRLLRGTGIEGLRGIPEMREPGILRPLLSFSRAELEAYAVKARLRPREDPTNRSPKHARNRVRHELVPLLERIHPGARASVTRLSRHAAGTAVLLDHVMEPLLEEVVVERTEGSIVLDRDRFHLLAPLEQGEVLRRLCESLGLTLSESGTDTTLQFMTTGQSGGQIQLPSGLRLRRSFEQFVLGLAERSGLSSEIEIPSLGEGRGEFVCSGRRYEARWERGRAIDDPRGEAIGWLWANLPTSELSFPLVLRGWHEGDRTRTRMGGKKLKKLFGELRLPREERAQVPILVDREGVALWIPGLHQVPGSEEGERWTVGVRDAGGVRDTGGVRDPGGVRGTGDV